MELQGRPLLREIRSSLIGVRRSPRWLRARRERAEVLEAVSQCPCALVSSGSDNHVNWEGLVVSMSKGVIGGPGTGEQTLACKTSNSLLRRGGGAVKGGKVVDRCAPT